MCVFFPSDSFSFSVIILLRCKLLSCEKLAIAFHVKTRTFIILGIRKVNHKFELIIWFGWQYTKSSSERALNTCKHYRYLRERARARAFLAWSLLKWLTFIFKLFFDGRMASNQNIMLIITTFDCHSTWNDFRPKPIKSVAMLRFCASIFFRYRVNVRCQIYSCDVIRSMYLSMST